MCTSGSCLGTVSNFQKYFADLLGTLGTSIDMKVTEPMVNFTKEEIPTTISVKKKWDSSRKDYDAAITKVVVLQKEKKPNPPKIQQAEQDRERLKGVYLQKGEEAFCSLLDTNEMSEFATLEKLLTYIESFYQFFRGGYQFLRDVHDNVVISHRQWIAEERSKYEQRKKKRPAGEWVPDSISGGAAAKTRMFGLPYDDIMRRDNPASSIPAFLERAIDFLEHRGLGIQGVFRVSPPKSQLDDTKKKIDSAQDIDWTQLDEHVCTGTIKLFLRELPQPLLTFELYTKFVTAADAEDDAAKVKAIKQVVGELPKSNLALLKRLLALMVLIERNKDVNKMTASNLAVVLCPSILYPEVPDPQTMVDDIQRANRVMSHMLTHYVEIFGSQVTGPKSVSFANDSASTSTQSSPALNSGGISTPSSLTSSSGGAKKTAVPPPHKTTSLNTLPVSGNQQQQQQQQPPIIQSSTDQVVHGLNKSGSSQSLTASSGLTKGQTVETTSLASSSSSSPSLHPVVVPQIQQTPPSQSPTLLATQTVPSPASQTTIPSIFNFNHSPVVSVDYTPKIDLTTMKTILVEKQVGPTFDYFMSLQEVSEATNQFASITLNPAGLSTDDLPALNGALKNLAKAIKNILTSLKEFSTKLPPELRNRLLMAAKDLQDRVLTTAGAFKELGEGQLGAATKLVDATRNFVVAAYAIAARLKEFSLVDELIMACDSIQSLVEDFPKAFAEDSTSVAVTTNSLQNASFKLTALLRAKILDSSQQHQVSALALCIESAEKETREICDTIKAMLFDESLGPDDIILSPALSSKLASLASTAKHAESFYEQLSTAQNPSISNASLFSPILEQLNTNINTHTANNDPTLQSIVSSLRTCSELVTHLKTIQPEMQNHRNGWIESHSKIAQQLTSISNATKGIINTTNDPTVSTTLNSYIKSLNSIAVMISLVSAAEAFEVQTCSDTLPRSMSLIKDFVFVSFPVLFNIRDALILIEEEKNQAAAAAAATQ
jgi:hypothetical protein